VFVLGEQSSAIRAEDLRRRLARGLLERSVGDRLPTVRVLAAQHRAGLASVQLALSRLEEDGAVSIVRRGRLGAYLAAKSLPGLWAAAEGSPFILALPLPSNLRGQGLATAIKTLLEEAGIDTFMTFVRGSRNRLRALREARCHVVVMSSLAASISQGPGVRIRELPPQTFAEERRVFYVGGEPGSTQDPGRRLRAVIDRDSADLQRLTELEFADQDVEFSPAVYMQSVRLIETGQADAAVWDLDETTRRLPPHVASRPLSPRVRAVVGDKDTRAAFVTRADDTPAQVVVDQVLLADRIVEIQQRVLTGELVPGY
jgi:hypothetical protein